MNAFMVEAVDKGTYRALKQYEREHDSNNTLTIGEKVQEERKDKS